MYDDKFADPSYSVVKLDSLENVKVYGALNYLLLISDKAYIFRSADTDNIAVYSKLKLPSFIITNKFQDYILSIELSNAKLFEIS